MAAVYTFLTDSRDNANNSPASPVTYRSNTDRVDQIGKQGSRFGRRCREVDGEPRQQGFE
jgi:hypothetical protein